MNTAHLTICETKKSSSAVTAVAESRQQNFSGKGISLGGKQGHFCSYIQCCGSSFLCGSGSGPCPTILIANFLKNTKVLAVFLRIFFLLHLLFM
jgi:hypothetical protein